MNYRGTRFWHTAISPNISQFFLQTQWIRPATEPLFPRRRRHPRRCRWWPPTRIAWRRQHPLTSHFYGSDSIFQPIYMADLLLYWHGIFNNITGTTWSTWCICLLVECDDEFETSIEACLSWTLGRRLFGWFLFIGKSIGISPTKANKNIGMRWDKIRYTRPLQVGDNINA